ncbi:SDR family NAD(P)-dependent oxidoreductase [Peptostreptococcus stomatis]|uniref:SDR family NAD(P)-dependent oxidoreductase n=1 Tax=Peptostreptococcus stomatis TaxID=341694 RepID=UPI0039954077
MEKDIRPDKWALVTGASSGIGREIVKLLESYGYGSILVARRRSRLEDLAEVLKYKSYIIEADLSQSSTAKDLCQKVDQLEEKETIRIDLLVNNAGFGDLGFFGDTDLDKELDMIHVNIESLHILMKHYLKRFVDEDRGHILNVASSAGLMPAGPYMSTYYATKAYVTSLTSGVAKELKDRGSRVVVSALCPGPVDTEFNDVANCSFDIGSIGPGQCAREALENLFKGKTIIVPSTKMKLATKFSKILTRNRLIDICGRQQKKKI